MQFFVYLEYSDTQRNGIYVQYHFVMPAAKTAKKEKTLLFVCKIEIIITDKRNNENMDDKTISYNIQ